MAEISPLTSLGESINALVQDAVAKATGTNQTSTAGTQQQTAQNTTAPTTSPITNPTPGAATPTDVSQTSQGLVKTTNMKTGEYVSPYQQQQQELLGQLQKSELPDVSQASKDYMNQMFQDQTKTFDYDIEKDPLVAKARQQVQQSIMDMANKRGFAYGSYESDQVKQQMEKLSPQFEQMAYDQNSDYLNRQLGLASTMMKWEKIQFDRSKNAIELLKTKLDFFNKLDDREFNVFKAMLSQRNTQRSLALQEKKFELERQNQMTTQALTRLDNLGYVDNQASIVLGFPVGAKAKWVQQATIEHQNKLELMAKENEYNLVKAKLDADIEKELYALKSKLDENSKMKYAAMEYQYKKDLQAMEYKYTEQRYQIQAAQEAAAAAAAKRSSGGGGGGGTSPASDKELSSRYTTEAKRFIAKFGNKKKYGQDAAQYLDNLRRAGVEPEVLMRIRQEFSVPNLAGAAKTIKGVDWSTGKLIVR
jgi:hypothetical protein